jgi:GNAT superfamily N-acetyltransferase
VPREATYRRARPEDAPALQAVVRAGFDTYRDFAPAGWVAPDQTAEDVVSRARVELDLTGTFALVAEVDGAVAGHVTLVRAREPSPDGSVPDQHLRHLFVLAPYWGTGIARTLHERMAEHVRGTARLYTPALQARARRFYEREGWTLHHGPFEASGIGLQLVEYRLQRPR